MKTIGLNIREQQYVLIWSNRQGTFWWNRYFGQQWWWAVYVAGENINARSWNAVIETNCWGRGISRNDARMRCSKGWEDYEHPAHTAWLCTFCVCEKWCRSYRHWR